MNDEYISDLLERAGDELAVGPVPLAKVHARAAVRGRRRMALTVLAAAAAVAAAIAGTVALVPDGKHEPDSVLAPKTRLVGMGHVAVEVPASWTSGQIACLPTRDAVVIGPLGRGDCIYQPRAANVETISLQRFYGDPSPRRSTRLVIDGHDAYADSITCTRDHTSAPVVCSATVTLPSENVLVYLSSTTSRAKVVDMEHWIRVLPDRIAVPPPGPAFTPSAGARYRDLLETAGFTAVQQIVVAERRQPGEITRIAPAPGSVLRPGSTVLFTVVRHAVQFSVAVANPGAPPFTLKDSTIRVAAYARTALGTRLTLFIKGVGDARKLVHVDANSHYLRPTPVVGAVPRGVSASSWTVVATGRTTVKISVPSHGHRTIIGYVVLRHIRERL